MFVAKHTAACPDSPSIGGNARGVCNHEHTLNNGDPFCSLDKLLGKTPRTLGSRSFCHSQHEHFPAPRAMFSLSCTFCLPSPVPHSLAHMCHVLRPRGRTVFLLCALREYCTPTAMCKHLLFQEASRLEAWGVPYSPYSARC